MQLTLMQQTLLLAFRVAFAWAGGLLLAVAVRALLPDQLGFTLTAKAGTYFLPFSRIGFWTCIWAALTVTVLVVVHAMIGDLASPAAH
ncbi:MAG TPA: hypothetical protein VG267_19785 [Terracidiphilus sp.]|jgi:hypothetical protein|nr:hypothetical protein [Terracidiphilus sp.]